MIRAPRTTGRRRGENTIALINVVFLMLVFFLIAGTLAPPADREVDFVTTQDAEPSGPPDMLFIRPDGVLSWRGEPVSIEDVADRWRQTASGEAAPLRIAADRALLAVKLLEIIDTLRRASIPDIVVVTELEAG